MTKDKKQTAEECWEERLLNRESFLTDKFLPEEEWYVVTKKNAYDGLAIAREAWEEEVTTALREEIKYWKDIRQFAVAKSKKDSADTIIMRIRVMAKRLKLDLGEGGK